MRITGLEAMGGYFWLLTGEEPLVREVWGGLKQESIWRGEVMGLKPWMVEMERKEDYMRGGLKEELTVCD